MFISGVSNTRLSRPAGASKYTVLGTLGEGRTGLTRLMKNKISLELVAAKWVEHTSGEALSKETEREIVNHRRLQHPNIIGDALSSFQQAVTELALCVTYAGSTEQAVQVDEAPLKQAQIELEVARE